MGFKKAISDFLEKYFFNPKWKCNVCGKEIFSGGYFCQDCIEKFPFQDENICNRCGRATPFPTNSCLNCENKLVSVDKARSLCRYDYPISSIVMKLKYGGNKYLASALTDFLYAIYLKSEMDADIVTFVPMTAKALKKRRYNHSKLLAEEFCKKANIPLSNCVDKIKETDRQAKLKGKERQLNLVGAFKVNDKLAVKDKNVLIIDDVTTTGATAECLAAALKKAGAKRVYLLTLASVSICY